VAQITADDVKAYITSLSARGNASPPGSAAQSTKRERFGKLHTFFEWLKGREVIDRVPTQELERPKTEPGTSYNVLSPADADRLLTATEGKWMQAVIEVALSTGLRLGELAHLRWADVDTSGLDHGPVEIRVTPRGTDESERGEWRPKTPHSKRAVQVYPRGRSVLEALWDGQDEEACVLREGPEQPLRHGWVQARMREARERAGFSRDISMHDLRHTWFSWLLNDLGMAKKAPAVSRMGGHAEISRTWSYVEASDEAGRDAVHESIGLKAPSGREEEVRAWLTAKSVVVSTEDSADQAVYNHR
jgi:integrase